MQNSSLHTTQRDKYSVDVRELLEECEDLFEKKHAVAILSTLASLLAMGDCVSLNSWDRGKVAPVLTGKKFAGGFALFAWGIFCIMLL